MFQLSKTLTSSVILGALAATLALAPVASESASGAATNSGLTGQELRWARPVVHLLVNAGDGTMESGSGVYVRQGTQLYLITAAHVISDANEDYFRDVVFRGAHANPAEADSWHSLADYASKVAMDEERDLAIYHLARPLEELRPARYRSCAARENADVVAFGFSHPYGRILRGSVKGLDRQSDRFIALDLPVRSGDSGGPIFDAETGALIGIVMSEFDPETGERFECSSRGDHTHCRSIPSDPPLGATALAINLCAL